MGGRKGEQFLRKGTALLCFQVEEGQGIIHCCLRRNGSSARSGNSAPPSATHADDRA